MPAAPPKPAAPTPVCALPPRYWWLKRICALTLAWIAFLVAVRLWWGWEADRRWEATIARYRAAGQPVFRADFAAAPIPDEENAATYLRAAIDVMNRNRLRPSIRDFLQDGAAVPDVSDEDMTQRLAAEEEILELIRRARACKHANWGTTNTPDDPLGHHLELKVMGISVPLVEAVERANLRANCAAALDYVRDMLALDRHRNALEANLLIGMSQVRWDRCICENLQSIVLTMRSAQMIATGDVTRVVNSRREITALLDDLLDERAWRDGWLRSLHGERALLLEWAADLCQDKDYWADYIRRTSAVLLGPPPPVLIGPMWTLDGLRAAEATTAIADAFAALRMPAASQLDRLTPDTAWANESLSCDFISRFVHGLWKGRLHLPFTALAERRLAATALAICLYEADHGRRPARLADLVPDYLPAIPADPLSPDDRPICYLPNDDLPRLYSVGLNGVDDGGQYEFNRNDISRDSPDYPVFFLQGIPTPAPPPDPNREVQTEPQRSN
jgi:hypothetical protein